MENIIMSPLKTLLHNTPQEWSDATQNTAYLLTGTDHDHPPEWIKAHYGDAFPEIECFQNYGMNDLVAKRADRLLANGGFKRIIPMAEADVLRAAWLRERHGLTGIRPEDAVYMRDKFLMKQCAAAAGVPVAEFRKVRNAFELLDFADAVGFPLVLKPISGKGSAETFILNSETELDSLLSTGIFAGIDREPDMLAEAFVDGIQLRVDGYYSQGVCRFMSAAQYIGSHIDFLHGGFMSSTILDAHSELSREVIGFTRNLLEKVLPFGPDGLFHVELWQRPDGKLVLGEAAQRLGGGSVSQGNRASFGVDFTMAAVRAFCGFEPHDWPQMEALQEQLAGQTTISPQVGVLTKVPQSAPFDWVLDYTHAPAGRRYQAMRHTNGEIATFIVSGATSDQVEERLRTCVDWFYANTEWSDE
ncbi:Biotin carboxylase [Streptomyces sp. 2323.1]|nr:Biotin carboxylase [Streptomyces sp. 2323.1]